MTECPRSRRPLLRRLEHRHNLSAKPDKPFRPRRRIPAGALAKPSGIEIHGDLVHVTDAADSTFHVFDKAGAALRTLATDLPAGSLAGFTFGPDGKIYFTDKVAGRVMRIDPL